MTQTQVGAAAVAGMAASQTAPVQRAWLQGSDSPARGLIWSRGGPAQAAQTAKALGRPGTDPSPGSMGR